MVEIKHSTKEYKAIHQWLLYRYGKATKCTNEHCKKKSNNFEWAVKKGFQYEKNIENYIEMCVPCHRIYDINEETIKKIKKNWLEGKHDKCRNRPQDRIPSKPVDMMDLQGIFIRTFESVCEASRYVGTYQTKISRAINAKSKSDVAMGYRWRLSIA